jgi:hypothetical protein
MYADCASHALVSDSTAIPGLEDENGAKKENIEEAD